MSAGISFEDITIIAALACQALIACEVVASHAVTSLALLALLSSLVEPLASAALRALLEVPIVDHIRGAIRTAKLGNRIHIAARLASQTAEVVVQV